MECPAQTMKFEDCPIRATLSVIGGKWKPLIFRELQKKGIGYGQLKRRIPEASQRMLTLQLRELERDGIVSRSVYRSKVVRTQYALTDYGRTLLPAMEALSVWGRKHRLRARPEPLPR
jgi:DNA-binding HxlR family transcriptional regulator